MIRAGGRRAYAAVLGGAFLAALTLAAPAGAAEIDNARAYCAKENAHWIGGAQQCACNAGYAQSGNTCVSAGAGYAGTAGGGFAVPPGALNAAVGGAIGSILGNALVAPLANPYQGHVRPKPVVGDEDESAPNAEVSGGVGDADDIIGGFIQSARFTKCLNDPLVFCSSRGLSDMSSLGENDQALADEDLHDALAEEPSAPKVPEKRAHDGIRDKIAEYWDAFTDAFSKEEIARFGIKSAHILSKAGEAVSEKIGGAATVVGVVDAAVSANKGDAAKAGGTLTGIAVAEANPAAGAALAVCGQSKTCTTGTVTGFNTVVGAPESLGGAAVKSFPSGQLIEGYKLQYGLTDEQALQKWKSEQDAAVNSFKNNAQNESFVKGALGASQ